MLDTLPEANLEAFLRLQQQRQAAPMLSQEAIEAAELQYALSWPPLHRSRKHIESSEHALRAGQTRTREQASSGCNTCASQSTSWLCPALCSGPSQVRPTLHSQSSRATACTQTARPAGGSVDYFPWLAKQLGRPPAAIHCRPMPSLHVLQRYGDLAGLHLPIHTTNPVAQRLFTLVSLLLSGTGAAPAHADLQGVCRACCSAGTSTT